MSPNDKPQTFVAPDGTEMVIVTQSLWSRTLEWARQAEATNHSLHEEVEKMIPDEVAYYVRLGLNRVAAWRKFRGLTQSMLADKAGVSQAAIARIEACPPGAGRDDTLFAIAKALGAPVTHVNPVPKTVEEKLRKAGYNSGNEHGRITRAGAK